MITRSGGFFISFFSAGRLPLILRFFETVRQSIKGGVNEKDSIVYGYVIVNGSVSVSRFRLLCSS